MSISPSLAASADTPTILVVEDDPGIAELERGRLEEAGYRVVVVATAGDAVRALARAGIDLILLDYRLPDETNGLDFLARVKDAGYDLPVILVTGFSDEATVIRALRAGVRDFVTKSLEYLDYLPEAVERVLRQVRTERRLAESEARLAGVIDSAKDAVIVIEADRSVSLFNPAAEKMFGCPAAEALGRRVTDFIPDELAPPPGTPDSTLVTMSHRLRAGTRGVKAGGDTFPIEATASRAEVAGRRFYTLVVRDVSARKKAEADLRRTTDLLHTVVEGTTDAIFVKDRDGRLLLINEAAARFVGRPPAELLGKRSTDLFDPEGARRVVEMEQAVMATGVPTTDEETLTAAGVTRTFLTTLAPNRDARGDIAGVIGIARDVTDRRRMAEERLELLARLQLHIERMPFAYVLFDADLRISEWNPAAERIFGYAREEMLGVGPPFAPIVPTRFHRASDTLLNRIRTGDMSAHSVNDNLTRDGRTITCEWFNTPFVDASGAFTGLLSLALDVTARRAADAALELRDRAIRAVAQGILITNPNQPDGPIVYASPGFERLTGYSAEAVVGRNCRFLQGKDTDPAAVARIRDAIRLGEPCTVELKNYRRDGTPFWNELSVSPVRDAAGRLVHFVGVQTDVTERHNLEEQFRQAQKMEAVGRLAGGVAHDFNNLLTIINGYGDILLGSMPKADRNRELVQEMVNAGERATGLTRQLLAFSRKAIIEPKVLALKSVVVELERMLRRIVGEDIDFTIATDPEPGLVKADAGQIEQVVLNLVVNARDAMPTTGRLTVEVRNVEVAEEYAQSRPDARPGPHVLLAVSDTGCGMDAPTVARIFEPFFTTKGERGTGLGLSTVHGIVKQAGGHLAVSSEVGNGSTFKVYLPRVDQKTPVSELKARSTKMPRGDETVLLVEDEDSVRVLTRHVLAGCGYKILEARDGPEAVRMAGEHRGAIDLVVTDVVMPRMSGREVAKRVAEIRPAVRILYLSGYTDDAVVRHGILEAEVAFLQKPFSPASLAQRVRTVLDRLDSSEN